MRDRRKEVRSHTRQQMVSLALDLTTLGAKEVEEALVYLYASNPVRWQQFMDLFPSWRRNRPHPAGRRGIRDRRAG